MGRPPKRPALAPADLARLVRAGPFFLITTATTSSKPVWSARAAPAPICVPATLTPPCQTPDFESRRVADETVRDIGALARPRPFAGAYILQGGRIAASLRPMAPTVCPARRSSVNSLQDRGPRRGRALVLKHPNADDPNCGFRGKKMIRLLDDPSAKSLKAGSAFSVNFALTAWKRCQDSRGR